MRSMGTAVLAVVAALPLLVIAATATSASASPAPITIAYVSSLTGQAASQDGSSPAGFEARIALQNAFGGVNGHLLVPLVIDDQTNPSLVVTAVQNADSKAFGIVSQSPIMYFASKYPQQAGVPVTGSYDDGPEWGKKPNTNMFASDEGSVNPKYPVNTLLGNFIKSHGGTVLGAYGYSISPSSSRAAIQTADAFKHAGGKVGVLDTTVPFGSVDFTSTALVAKQKKIDALVPALDNDSNYALATSLKQAGVKLKAVLFATGYEPSVIHSAGVEDPPGRLLPVSVPAVLPPQHGYQADGGGTAEVPALLQEPVPDLLAVRVVGRCRPHDQGPGDGGAEPDPGRGHQEAPRAAVLQRQRAVGHVDQLFDHLWARLDGLRLGHEGADERFHGGLHQAVLREGPAGHGDSELHVARSHSIRW